MSTVTLSKPHCEITSAENPDGIARQALNTDLPEAHTFLTLLATLCSFPVWYSCHCEECCDEAIHYFAALDCSAACNDGRQERAAAHWMLTSLTPTSRTV